MSPDDYRGRKLRHRATGHEGEITTYATNIIGQVRFRIRYADGSVDHVSAGVIAASFDWTDEPAVVALPENVVHVQFRQPRRVVPIGPNGSGSAA